MSKKKIAAVTILLLACAASYGQPTRSTDGCAVLRHLVQNSVHAAATEFEAPASGQRVHLRMRPGGSLSVARPQACARTAEVATRAFTRALAGLNIEVKWTAPAAEFPGNYCPSVDLRKCFPSQDPQFPIAPGYRLAFIYDAWKGVRHAVTSQMPRGAASGISRFTARSLDSALLSNLHASIDGPLYSNDQSSRRAGARR